MLRAPIAAEGAIVQQYKDTEHEAYIIKKQLLRQQQKLADAEAEENALDKEVLRKEGALPGSRRVVDAKHVAQLAKRRAASALEKTARAALTIILPQVNILLLAGELFKLRKLALEKLCQDAGLPKSGNMTVLVARLVGKEVKQLTLSRVMSFCKARSLALIGTFTELAGRLTQSLVEEAAKAVGK